MSVLKRSLIVPRLLQRHFFISSKLAANPCPPTRNSDDFQREIVVHPNLKKLKENQRKFQVDDGLPVWLKGGFRDKLLFQLTLILMAVGLVMSGQVVYELIMRDFK